MEYVFINHNGGSPLHGPNMRTYYAAKALYEKGHSVTIVSSSYSHKYVSSPQMFSLIQKEKIDGINYCWIRTIRYKNLISRIYSHFEFSFKFLLKRKNIFPKKIDHLIFSGPPPEIFFFSWLISKIYSCKISADIRDLWPRVQLDMNKFNYLNPYVLFLFFAQLIMFKLAFRIISPIQNIEKYLNSYGVSEKSYVIENGFDLDKLPDKKTINLSIQSLYEHEPDSRFINTAELRKKYDLIIGYSGSFDRDNELSKLFDAAEVLQNQTRVLFLLVGGGIKTNLYLNKAKNLSNVLIANRVPASDVVNVIRAFDICFVSLKPKPIHKYGIALAKIYEYMAASKPIIWMIDSEVNIINQSGGGFSCLPNDLDELIRIIKNLSSMDKSELHKMGNKNFEYLNKYNSYEYLGSRWNKILRNQNEL